MTTPAHIQSEAQGIKTVAPYLTTGKALSYSLREQCERLAVLAGMSVEVASDATDNDLISVYLTALKNGSAAMQVAAKVAARLGDTGNPFASNPSRPVADAGDTLIPAPRERPGNVPTRPERPATPSAPDQAPGASLDAVRDLIKREVREGALEPLQGALERTVETFYKELANVPLAATETALAAMQSAMETHAHAAALAALKTLAPTVLEIVRPDAPAPVSLGIVHKRTPLIINALRSGANVYLHGPAGSGKTTVAQKAADAFGLQLHTVAKVESEYLLLGFRDARGETVRTPFREAYEHGGVFLFDELDRSSPGAVTALNMALANGFCPFPDALVKRHPDCHIIGAGNTALRGADSLYTGANQLDASSIDRFDFIEFGYDDDLERALASDASWCAYVQRVRQVIAERGLDVLVTPRATYAGCKRLADGFDRETVKEMVVYKGLDRDTIAQIEAAL